MKDTMHYLVAIQVAQALEIALSPACERTLIAGSLRRKKPTIGDIELVVQPKVESVLDMFGAPASERSLLDEALAGLGAQFTKSGAKYKQFVWDDCPIDLFIATRDTWGCIATIRTGSADFTHWLVSPRRHGGACPSHLRFSEGRIWEGGKALETTEEADVFSALGQRWIEPSDRIAGRWAR